MTSESGERAQPVSHPGDLAPVRPTILAPASAAELAGALPAAGESVRCPVRFAGAALLVLLSCFCFRKVDSPDIGFHLRAGAHILEGNGWPRKDPFSYAMSQHDYVDMSWGYQVLVRLTESLGGAHALILLHAGFVLATALLLWRTARIGTVGAAPFFVLAGLGILACEMRIESRPELLSYLLLAVVGMILHEHVERRRSWLWALPLVFVFWANCHSLFILGLLLVACCVVGTALERGSIDRRLTAWAIAGLAACFLNPYGVTGVCYPLTLLTRFEGTNPFHLAITEQFSPFDARVFEGASLSRALPIWSFRCFAALAFVAAWNLARKGRFWPVLAILVLAWPATKMLRNTPVLVVAGLAPTVWGLSMWATLRGPRLEKSAALLVGSCALLLASRVRTDAYYVDARRPKEHFGFGWNHSALPIDALSFVRESRIEGRVLNHLNLGGWLMWDGRHPVYVDGRLEVVGEKFFLESEEVFSSPEAFDACAGRWDVSWTIFPPLLLPDLVARLSRDSRWKLAYADAVAIVFVSSNSAVVPRSCEGHESYRERFASLPGMPGGSRRPSPTEVLLEGFWRKQEYPLEDAVLANVHLLRGENELAAAHCVSAIEQSRGKYLDLYPLLSSILEPLGDRDGAVQCRRIALREGDDDPHARRALDRLERPPR